MANADSKDVLTFAPEAEVTIKLGELSALRNALSGLLAEVEYAIDIGQVPLSWTEWQPPDKAIVDARAIVAKFR